MKSYVTEGIIPSVTEWRNLHSVMTVVGILVSLATTPAQADMDFKGKLEVQTPVYHNSTPDRPQDRSPMLIGAVSFPNLIGSFTPSFEYRYNTNRNPRSVFWKENRMIIGVDTPLNKDRDLILFGFWERRDFFDQDRFVVGLRYNFQGKM